MNNRKEIRDAIKCLVVQPNSCIFVNYEQIDQHYFFDAVKGLEFPWPTPVVFMRGGTDISLFTEDQLLKALELIRSVQIQTEVVN